MRVLLVVVVVDESLGVWVDIVESVVEVLVDVESGVDIVESDVIGEDVLGDPGVIVLGDDVIGPVVDGDVVVEPGEAGVVCANAAEESVMAAIAVSVAIRIGVIL